MRDAVITPLSNDEGHHGYRPIASWTHRATLRLRTSHRISQLRAVPAQPNQFFPFVLAERATTALTAPPVSVNPVAQRPIMDPQFPGNLRNRLASLPDQPHRTLLEALIELPACL